MTTSIIHGKVISREIVAFANTVKADKEDEIRNGLKTDKQKLQLFDSDLIFEVRLQVLESLKGNIGDTVTIFTPIAGASCGYRFELGNEYIVYASAENSLFGFFLTESQRKEHIEKENTYWTSHCTRTAVYSKQEAEELKRLNK